jgi:acetyltransferase-like isoleucine patch superfamily enzyme
MSLIIKSISFIYNKLIVTNKLLRGFYHFKLLRHHNGNFFIGKNFKILGNGFIFRDGLQLGDNCWFECVQEYKGFKYNPQLIVGKGFNANNNVHIAAANKLVFGNNVLIGSNVLISDHNHGGYGDSEHTSPNMAPNKRPIIFGGIEIGDNVWISDGVVINGKCKIGSGVVIGANSVVVNDIEPNCIAAGVPAKIIKKWDSDLNKWISIK